MAIVQEPSGVCVFHPFSSIKKAPPYSTKQVWPGMLQRPTNGNTHRLEMTDNTKDRDVYHGLTRFSYNISPPTS